MQDPKITTQEISATIDRPESFAATPAAVEALLFAATEPMRAQALADVLGCTVSAVEEAVTALEQSLAHAGRGVCVAKVGGGYQLRTKLEHAELVKVFLAKTGRVGFKLSRAALEVLSIVAYRQPIIKHDIDHVRGVDSGHLLRMLMKKSLVRFCGKSPAPGRPMLYGTSKKFLEVFSLGSLKDLPSMGEIEELVAQRQTQHTGAASAVEPPKGLADLALSAAAQKEQDQSLGTSYDELTQDLRSIEFQEVVVPGQDNSGV